MPAKKAGGSRATGKGKGKAQGGRAAAASPFSQEEELLIIHLKEVEQGLDWKEIWQRFAAKFPATTRTQGGLQVHYSRALKDKGSRRRRALTERPGGGEASTVAPVPVAATTSTSDTTICTASTTTINTAATTSNTAAASSQQRRGRSEGPSKFEESLKGLPAKRDRLPAKRKLESEAPEPQKSAKKARTMAPPPAPLLPTTIKTTAAAAANATAAVPKGLSSSAATGEAAAKKRKRAGGADEVAGEEEVAKGAAKKAKVETKRRPGTCLSAKAKGKQPMKAEQTEAEKEAQLLRRSTGDYRMFDFAAGDAYEVERRLAAAKSNVGPCPSQPLNKFPDFPEPADDYDGYGNGFDAPRDIYNRAREAHEQANNSRGDDGQHAAGTGRNSAAASSSAHMPTSGGYGPALPHPSDNAGPSRNAPTSENDRPSNRGNKLTGSRRVQFADESASEGESWDGNGPYKPYPPSSYQEAQALVQQAEQRLENARRQMDMLRPRNATTDRAPPPGRTSRRTPSPPRRTPSPPRRTPSPPRRTLQQEVIEARAAQMSPTSRAIALGPLVWQYKDPRELRAEGETRRMFTHPHPNRVLEWAMRTGSVRCRALRPGEAQPFPDLDYD